MSKEDHIVKELRIIRALSAELIQRTSRLEEKLSPVQEGASRKGLTKTEEAVMKRNKRMSR